MKKLALLMVLVLVFSLSCVFATDTAAPLTLSGEVVSGEDTVTAPETVITSGEEDIITEDPISGEIVDTEGTDEPTVDVENAETPDATEDEEEVPSSNNSAIIGAIIAIVIVVAVVAIAAILRKD